MTTKELIEANEEPLFSQKAVNAAKLIKGLKPGFLFSKDARRAAELIKVKNGKVNK